MPSNKDPKDIQTGTGHAGEGSVSQRSIRFEVDVDGKWFDEITADDITVRNVTITQDLDGSNATATFDELNANTANYTDLTAETGTFTNYVATDILQTESGTEITTADLDVPTLNATNVDANSITAETGTFTNYVATDDLQAESGTEITTANLDVPDLTATNLTAETGTFTNYVATDELQAESGTEITTPNLDVPDLSANNVEATSGAFNNAEVTGLLSTDTISTSQEQSTSFLAGTIFQEPSTFQQYIEVEMYVEAGDEIALNASNPDAEQEQLLSRSTQRFGSLTQAFGAFDGFGGLDVGEDAGLDVGETGIIEPYDATSEFGDIEAQTSFTNEEVLDIDADGIRLFLISDDSGARAFTRDGIGTDTPVDFTLDNFDPETETLSHGRVETNGQFVAFLYTRSGDDESFVEVFNIEDETLPVWDLSASTLGFNEFYDFWMSHDSLYVAAELSARTLITQYTLNDGTEGWDLESQNGVSYTRITGYGDRIIGAAPETGGSATFPVQMFDTEDGSTVGAFWERTAFSGDPVDIKTDGSLIYITKDASGTGGNNWGEGAVIPFNRDGLEDVPALFQYDSGNNGENGNAHFAFDHRYIYITDDASQIQVINKKTQQIQYTIDTGGDPEVITRLVSDGQSLFGAGNEVGTVNTGTEEDNIASFYTLHEPAAFLRVGPSLDANGRMFYNHFIPVNHETGNFEPDRLELNEINVNEIEANVVSAQFIGAENVVSAPNVPIASTQFQLDLDEGNLLANERSSFGVSSITTNSGGGGNDTVIITLNNSFSNENNVVINTDEGDAALQPRGIHFQSFADGNNEIHIQPYQYDIDSSGTDPVLDLNRGSDMSGFPFQVHVTVQDNEDNN